MTTWYTAPAVGLHGGPLWAFSVRPDLWPAGTCAWVMGGHAAQWGHAAQYRLADFDESRTRTRPAPESDAPGAAEALVLGGRVAVLANNARDMPWTPEDP